MQQLPKEFVGRMVRTVLFIGLVAACCAGVATFGMFVASKFNLTTSRNQVPLTSVKIEGEKVLIPENGKTTREAGWTLRNSRGQYILTLDELEAGSLDTAEPVIEVEGDLILQLKKDTRISIRNIELKNNYEHKKVVVPGKTLQEVSKILPGSAEEDVNMFLTDNHIVFEFDDTTVVSRLIEGEYFKIEQMLSSDYETKVKINKRELLDCIDRATLLVKEGDKKPIIMNVTDGNMELKINSFIGSMNEDIDIVKEGKDILIGFNPKFFIDALRVIDEEEVSLYMVNPKAPCFIKDDEGKFIYLILPVNFNASTV